jgi:hypothetical protein
MLGGGPSLLRNFSRSTSFFFWPQIALPSCCRKLWEAAARKGHPRDTRHLTVSRNLHDITSQLVLPYLTRESIQVSDVQGRKGDMHLQLGLPCKAEIASQQTSPSLGYGVFNPIKNLQVTLSGTTT